MSGGVFVVRKIRAIGYSPTGSHHRRRWIVIAGLVAVSLGLLGASFAIGRSTAPAAATTAGSSAPALRNGVPVPNRHTPAGAATAAANFQIAGFRVATGTLDPLQAGDVLLANDADDDARAVLAAPTASTGQLREERTTFAPLSIVVSEYHHTTAVVQVWGVSTTSSRTTPQPGGTETWGRSTVRLAWAGSQWRVRSQEYDRGPWPVRSDVRLTDSEGDFSFRFDELTQHGWTYVPES
jgi:hypothetical protein